ncbi:hypothetical protein HPP92_022973 [Vanilla planifolia]|uniref:Uncharacterized protein n=1 Tax=Vanilla planifolia TaxID=51239 RepID=A0A835PT93_VANPL|nr:hypothetical protein HPP92_023238 [Vanilla planifolia]KAG0459845.1 hypothetical protein HPP92_022973 [Vanilla planifolia]
MPEVPSSASSKSMDFVGEPPALADQSLTHRRGIAIDLPCCHPDDIPLLLCLSLFSRQQESQRRPNALLAFISDPALLALGGALRPPPPVISGCDLRRTVPPL